MTIERGEGDLLKADVEALVNPVNTRGVMGKGLALQFKKAFPEVFGDYARAWRAGEVVVGKVFVVERVGAPRWIVHFPTRDDWRGASRVEWVRDGPVDLVREVEGRGIGSIAVPALGCRLGGLEWGGWGR